MAARVDVREGEGTGLRRRTRRTGDTGEPQVLPSPFEGSQRAATASAFDALDLEPPASVARPRSNVRWVFALLLLAGVVGVILVVGRSYLNKPRQVDAYDAQVDALLESGHGLLGRGDIGGARRQFEQARELARDNPKVLTAELVLQGTVCDQSWLGARLQPEDSPEAAAARSALGDCSRELGTLTARARQVSPVPPELDAALVDAFRLQDDLAQARTHAVKLSQHATLPAAAYALGMLDVGDASPGWATVIDRLRLATSAERIPGRAHFALAFALMQSGDFEAARAELGKLKATSRPHPLTDRLEAVIEERAASTDPASAAPETGEPSADKAAAPSQQAPPPQHGASQSGSAPGTDPMEAARAARAKGDLTAAERFYQQALQLDPGNVGALTGLGDVERGRGNKLAALSHYHAALRVNGQHPPAIAGAAEVLWSNGDRAEAVKYYRRIAPGNTYSARAQQRIAEFEGASREPASGSAPEKPEEATPKPEEPPEPAEEPKAKEPEPEPEPEPVPVPRESPPSIPGPAPKDAP